MVKKTIRDVWVKIPTNVKSSILADIVGEGHVSIATAYKWVTAKRRPLPLYRELIASIFSRHTGRDYSSVALFTDTDYRRKS